MYFDDSDWLRFLIPAACLIGIGVGIGYVLLAS
jgi:hypothetical protein